MASLYAGIKSINGNLTSHGAYPEKIKVAAGTLFDQVLANLSQSEGESGSPP